MNTGWNVSANDLKNWTQQNKRLAEGLLPKLVRDLIMASVKPESISMPYGDSVNAGGIDGILDNNEKHIFVPTGKSYWEFGTNGSINAKADNDYNKRSQRGAVNHKKDKSFVFVTTRHWQDKDGWVEQKVKEKKWKKVIGINADDLAAWLLDCPAVHRSFARLIGKITDDVLEIDYAWDIYRHHTNPVLTQELLLCGREDEFENTRNLLSQPTGKIIYIDSNSEYEAYGFLLATITSEPLLVSRSLIIKTQSEWDQVIKNHNGLILIPRGFIPENLGITENKGHTAILLDIAQNNNINTISLNKYIGSKREKSLEDLGLSKENARKIYHDTKGFIAPIMRHKLMKPKEVMQPEWVKAKYTDVLVAILFAGTWSENNEPDMEILSELAGVEYINFLKILEEIIELPDPPLRKIGGHWQIISKVDLWHFLSKKVSKQHFINLEAVVYKVVGEADPTYELDPDRRWMANLLDKKRITYSPLLKENLAKTVALIAAWAEQLSNISPEEATRFTDKWVTDLLLKKNYGKTWYSLGGCLRYLAEASPKVFLEAVENGSKSDKPPISHLFEPEGTYGSFRHANLIFALEVISLDRDSFSKVVKCLAQLVAFHKNENQGNSPTGTMRDLFISWINYTPLNYEEKLSVLKNILIPYKPEVAFNLMSKLLYQWHDHASFNPKPEYRNWLDGTNQTVTRQERHKYTLGIFDLLFKMVQEKPNEHCLNILEKIDELPYESLEKFTDWLYEWGQNDIDEELRENISKVLGEKIGRHREFPDSDWSMPEKYIILLESGLEMLRPRSTYYKYKYLFDDYSPQGLRYRLNKYNDYRKSEEVYTRIKVHGIKKIFEELGFKGIEKLTLDVKYSSAIGLAIANSKYKAKLEVKILNWLNSKEINKQAVARTYVYSRYRNDESILHRHNKDFNKWPVKKSANYLLSLPTIGEIFKILGKTGKNIQDEYWKSIQKIYFDIGDKNLVNTILKNLLEHKKVAVVLDLVEQIIHLHKDKIDIDNFLLADALDMYIGTEKKERMTNGNLSHAIIVVIQYLQDQGKIPGDRMALLEWKYLSIMEHTQIRPKNLIEEFYERPDFFVYMTKVCYKKDDGTFEKGIPQKVTELFAKQGYILLNIINRIPGQNENGTINEATLYDWIIKARELFKNINRVSIGDNQIGKILSNSPKGSDGHLLHESVRNLIEQIASEKMEIAINCGIVNSFGVTTRSMECGGSIERGRAEYFNNMAQNVTLQWPRTADIFRQIARSEETHAKWEDETRDLREW